MADNIALNAGSGGATIATDDDGVAHHQYVKLEFGPDNTQTKVTAAVGLPVGVVGTVTVDGSAVTQPVSLLSVPSHAVTNAGTFAVQADTELTTADLDTGAGTDTRAVAGLVYGASGGGVLVSTTNPLPVGDNGGSLTVDNAGTFATQAAQSGTWNITNVSGTVSLPTGASTAAKQPALGTAGTPSADVITVQGSASGTAVPVSLASVPSHAVTNAGTFAVQVDGAALTALQLIDDPVLVDDAGFTPATSKVMMAGFQADEASTDSVDEGDAGAARMTLDRKLIVTPQPHAAGGLTIFRSLDLDESEEEVAATACTVYGAWVTNTATTTRWLKFYNATAANTTVGTTTPVITIGIPGNTSDDISANFGPGGMGISFGTALSVAATTGVADADVGAPAVNDLIVNLFYKA